MAKKATAAKIAETKPADPVVEQPGAVSQAEINQANVTTSAGAETAEGDDLDDLLGDLPDKQQIVDSAKTNDAALTGEAKATKPPKEKKPPRELKGVPVRFTTKGTGETIEGLGVTYYVVRANGKLYYKQADQVTLLEDEEDVDVEVHNAKADALHTDVEIEEGS